MRFYLTQASLSFVSLRIPHPQFFHKVPELATELLLGCWDLLFAELLAYLESVEAVTPCARLLPYSEKIGVDRSDRILLLLKPVQLRCLVYPFVFPSSTFFARRASRQTARRPLVSRYFGWSVQSLIFRLHIHV